MTDEERLAALEERVKLLEYIVRYAIGSGSWPADIRWPIGSPPEKIEREGQ